MPFVLTAGGLLEAVAVAIVVALLFVGIAWLVTWILSHRD